MLLPLPDFDYATILWVGQVNAEISAWHWNERAYEFMLEFKHWFDLKRMPPYLK